MDRSRIARAAPLFAAVARPVQAFVRLEAASGIVLLTCAVAALALANSGASELYRAVLAAPLELAAGPLRARSTLAGLVNDGLMTVFFFVVGMEIKRELAIGELRTVRQAMLPLVAAVGGMLVPAAVYLGFNATGPGRPGWGIPMATDIAFCVGVLTLLRARVPHALVVFVTALAIFDDLGGILVIALFYGHGLSVGWLVAAAAIVGALAGMSRAHVRGAAAYAAAGAALWYALHHAGIHATIAGVIVGLAIPVRSLARYVHVLHPWVAFGVMPLFALANSGVDLRALDPALIAGPIAVGTGVALFLGKQAGIFLFTWTAVRAGLAPMPGGASAGKLLGVATVAGIGFTVALFIAGLAFPERPELLDHAKVGILGGSLVSGLVGAIVLRCTAPERAHAAEPELGLRGAR